jgi:hypothetical protein
LNARAAPRPRAPRIQPLPTEQRSLRAGAVRRLVALATFHPGVMTKPQIARAAGLRVTSGTFSTYWSELRQQAFLDDASASLYRATDRGLAAHGSARPALPRTFAERRAFWEARLRLGERRLLEIIIAASDAGISRAELAKRAQMSVTSGTFSTYLSTLNNNRLIERVGSQLKVHPWLPPRTGRAVKLTEQKNFRLSDRESKAVERAAREAGVTESVWLRLVVRAALGETDLLAQLSRVAPSPSTDPQRSPEPPQLRVVSSSGSRPTAVSGKSLTERDPRSRNDVVAIAADDAVAARFFENLEQQRRKAGATNERWGNDSAERMQRLCRVR